jgi:hypothetical protein
MGYLGRRIGKSQDQGDSNPGGANGAVGGGILNLFENGYFERQGDIYNAPGAPAIDGIEASGGTLQPGGVEAPNGFTYHVFTAPGTFTVSQSTGTGDAGLLDIMVIGGGGAGGRQHGGGGGAGSVVLNTFTAVSGSYPITVGDGGTHPQSAPFNNTPGASGAAGGFSRLGAPGEPVFVHANGGGGGSGFADSTNAPGGGSGGGRCNGSSRDAGQTFVAPPTSPATQNVDATGGRSFQNFSGLPDNGGPGGGPAGVSGAGGGGAGGLGGNSATFLNGSWRGGGNGGIGMRVPEFAAPLLQPAIPTPDWSAFNTAVGPTGLYGGGGGGGGRGAGPRADVPGPQNILGGLAGPGGGGAGGAFNPSNEAASGTGDNGTAFTGGGGGAGGSNDVGAAAGGKGIVCVRYRTPDTVRTSISVSNPSGTLVAPNPGGYEVRYFTTSGALTVSSGTITDAEVIVVGGGGGNGFGGGGGGGVVHARNVTLSPTGGPGSNGVYPVVIGSGGSGRANTGNAAPAGNGTDSFFGAPSASGSYLQGKGGGGTVGPTGGNSNSLKGSPGGSGGGGGHPASGSPPWNPEGNATQPGTPQPLDATALSLGTPGGRGGHPYPHGGLSGGGGGGAGHAGYPEMPPAIPTPAPGGGMGGDGYFVPWCPETLGDAGAFGGGGGGAYGKSYPVGGGSSSPRVGLGGLGGGGHGSGYGTEGVPTGGTSTYNNQTVNSGAHANTGGGAGGSNGGNSTGANGMVLVRYRAT